MEDVMIVNVSGDTYDLRLPADRDRCVRAIWHKLRPTEPEPLTAPAFHWLGSAGNYATAWVMEVRDPPHGLTLSCGFAAVRYPALTSVPLDSPDRDLLALAEVAKAVLA